MNRISKLLKKKDTPIKDNSHFWGWFAQNEKAFFRAIKNGTSIEPDFFDKLSPKLDELRAGYFFLAGMIDDHTAELVITAEGSVRNIVFVEDLIDAAPSIPGWKFTALKPPLDISNVSISMGDFTFERENIWFYSNDHRSYPDEIDITIVHRDLTEDNKSAITTGCYIFLDNYLGELNLVTGIDNMVVVGPESAEQELVPIEKLKDFLLWREKEFVEKYDGLFLNTDKSNYAVLEAELESGSNLVAAINTDLLKWDKTASHPWILVVEIPFAVDEDHDKMDDVHYEALNVIEDEILAQLKDSDGYLNIGRQTARGTREIYFACREFRKPSKVLDEIVAGHSEYEINYDIYKDKYWRTFDRFQVA